MSCQEELVQVVQSTREKIEAFQNNFEIFRDTQITPRAQSLKNAFITLQRYFSTLLNVDQIDLNQLQENIAYTLAPICMYEETFSGALTPRTSQFVLWLYEVFILKRCFTRQRLFDWKDTTYILITSFEIQIRLQQLSRALYNMWKINQDIWLDWRNVFAPGYGLNLLRVNVSDIFFPNDSGFIVYSTKLETLLMSIYTKHSLLIEKQPAQIIMKSAPATKDTKERHDDDRTTTRTSVSLCLLDLDNFKHFPGFEVTVDMHLVHTEDVERMTQLQNFKVNPVGTLCQARVNINQSDKYISQNMVSTSAITQDGVTLSMKTAHIQHICVSNVKRNGKKDVNKDKVCILVTAKIPFFDDGNIHQVWTVSEPLIIRTHGIQSDGAYATISWDNYFSDLSRTSFEVKTHATWQQLKGVLQAHFNEWIRKPNDMNNSVNRTLTEDNLNYLASKIHELVGPTNIYQDMIPLKSLYFGQGQNSLSFWVWFFKATMVLKNKFFKKAWNQGYIAGFVNEDVAKTKVKECAPGTCIIKFSETEPGALTLVFCQILNDARAAFKTRVNLNNLEPRSIDDFINHIYLSNVNVNNGNYAQRAFSYIYSDVLIETAFPLKIDDTRIRQRQDPNYLWQQIFLR